MPTAVVDVVSERPLAVSMLPTTLAFAPADVRLVVHVAGHSANRRLTFVLDGPMWRSSEEMLEGDDAPRVRTYWFRNVPPGRYTVGVVLDRNDNSAPITWTETLCVRGAGSDETCGMGDGG